MKRKHLRSKLRANIMIRTRGKNHRALFTGAWYLPELPADTAVGGAVEVEVGVGGQCAESVSCRFFSPFLFK